MLNPYFDLELEKLIELLAHETESFAHLSPIYIAEEEIVGSKTTAEHVTSWIDLRKDSGAPS